MGNSKRNIFIILGIVLVLLAAGGYYYHTQEETIQPLAKQNLKFDRSLEQTDHYISIEKLKDNTERYYNYGVDGEVTYYLDTKNIKEMRNEDGQIILKGRLVIVDYENLVIDVFTELYYYNQDDVEKIYKKVLEAKDYTLEGSYLGTNDWDTKKQLINNDSLDIDIALAIYYCYYGKEFRPEDEQK